MKAKKSPTEGIGKDMKIFTSPTECLEILVVAYTGYLTVAEQESTKRQEIEARKEETIAKINAQRELLMQYLDRSFDERAENFHSLFKAVDQAIANENNEQLAAALSTIVEIAKSCPFKNLADLASVRASLNDPNHVWEF